MIFLLPPHISLENLLNTVRFNQFLCSLNGRSKQKYRSNQQSTQNNANFNHIISRFTLSTLILPHSSKLLPISQPIHITSLAQSPHMPLQAQILLNPSNTIPRHIPTLLNITAIKASPPKSLSNIKFMTILTYSIINTVLTLSTLIIKTKSPISTSTLGFLMHIYQITHTIQTDQLLIALS